LTVVGSAAGKADAVSKDLGPAGDFLLEALRWWTEAARSAKDGPRDERVVNSLKYAFIASVAGFLRDVDRTGGCETLGPLGKDSSRECMTDDEEVEAMFDAAFDDFGSFFLTPTGGPTRTVPLRGAAASLGVMPAAPSGAARDCFFTEGIEAATSACAWC
jgi:hypothetical protein